MGVVILGVADGPKLKMAADTAPLLSDSLIAQLLDMGFEQESINACEAAMNSSGSPITLQSATEW